MKAVKVKIAKKIEKEVHIFTDYIRLDAALKLADAVQTGGHAKMVILDGEIKVNGEVCDKRGKKLRDGDNFEFEHILYHVVKG